MICKHCGENIDPRKRRTDGSLQCPHCKVIYRPRNPQSRPQQAPSNRRPCKKNTSFTSHLRSIPWKKKLWKLPIWAWCTIAILLLISSFSSSDSDIPTTTEINSPEITAGPASLTDTVNESSIIEDWGDQFEANKADVLAYIDTVFAPYEYYNKPTLDYSPSQPDYYFAYADITVNGSDTLAVQEALKSIDSKLQNAPYTIDFSISIFSNQGASLCMVGFGGENEGYTIISSGKSHQFNNIDEITIDHINTPATEETKHTATSLQSFLNTFESGMQYLGYLAPLTLMKSDGISSDQGFSTYASGDWYAITLKTTPVNETQYIVEALIAASGDGTAESGVKAMSAFASSLYAFNNTLNAETATSIVLDIMDGIRTYETENISVAMSHTDVMGYMMSITGKVSI